MEKMPVFGYTPFLHASGVLTPQTDRLVELTPKNVRLQRGVRTRRPCPTRRSERAEEHLCLSRTVTLWSNIFNLASFGMSVNQRALSVWVSDDIDLGVTERGARCSLRQSSIWRQRQRPFQFWVSCHVFPTSTFDRSAQVTHRVLQLRSCHALSSRCGLLLV